VDGDGDFDQADVDRIIGGDPLNPSIDVTGDGRKDLSDSWQLPLLLTRWDVHADGRVEATDATAPTPVALPRPDATEIETLLVRVETGAREGLPPDFDARLRSEWDAAVGPTDPTDQASLYEQAGAQALLGRNLEEAQWAFAMAAGLAPERPAAYAGVAFTLLQQGKETDAMALYARALQLHPEGCAVLASVGSVYSSHGHQDTAERYHRRAVGQCPGIFQYHLNLGASLLRQGRQAEAHAEFTRAHHLAPGDGEAMVLAFASDPARLETPPPYEALWETERAHVAKDQPEEAAGMPLWADAGADVQIMFIIADAARPIIEEHENGVRLLGEQYSERIGTAAQVALPKGKDACADARTWNETWEPTFRELNRLVEEGLRASYDLNLAYQRRLAAATLSRDRDILQAALTEAQRYMVLAGNSPEARQIFEATVDELYTRTLQAAAQQMAHPDARPDVGVAALDAGNAREAVALGFMAIVSGAMSDPEYAANFGSCDAKLEGGDPGNPSIGVDLVGVGVEYKPRDCEFKLEAGKGVMVAGTWSPTKGFGFQHGYGWKFGKGPLSAGGAHWTKMGSDGSMSEETEGSAGFGEGLGFGWEVSREREICPAENEPVGTWGWAASVLGCEKKAEG
jgi:hypothetical protein